MNPTIEQFLSGFETCVIKRRNAMVESKSESEIAEATLRVENVRGNLLAKINEERIAKEEIIKQQDRLIGELSRRIDLIEEDKDKAKKLNQFIADWWPALRDVVHKAFHACDNSEEDVKGEWAHMDGKDYRDLCEALGFFGDDSHEGLQKMDDDLATIVNGQKEGG